LALALTLALAALAGVAAGCGGAPAGGPAVVTFPGSALGAEAEVLATQLARFAAANPDVVVEQRRTPDAADQRHQLYVQWLNAGAGDPDILQLDVVWTAEFGAAGWILPLDRFAPDVDAFFPATIEADRWRGTLYALPWFVDMGMLYWRTDLLERPPASFAELSREAAAARRRAGLPYGFVWQGARYEGLVTVFLEHLGGFGGTILDASGRVAVDSEAAVEALTYMCDSVRRDGVVPEAALTWQEEQVRFAFQNGQAVLMRNWPYAFPLLADPGSSAVAGRFAVAPMPAGPGGHPTAALGGAQLAINAHSEHPEAAWRVIDFLTRPEQMLERARVTGQFPTREAIYDSPELASALAVEPAEARRNLTAAVPRPVTPEYTQLSQILQIHLHRALTGQAEPRPPLGAAAAEMRALLERVGLAPGEAGAAGAAGGGA
jgi:multiple sugar transport system substrate-binding protein